jgi:hypothetical protein
MPHGGAQHPPHRGVQPPEFVVVQACDRPQRAQTGLPADLVGEQVAEPGDHRLVHQHRLEPAPPALQHLPEPPQVDAERIGPLSAHHAGGIVLVRHQPHAAQLAQVGVPQLAPVERHHQPLPALLTGAGVGVVRMAGHAAVH